MIIFLPCFQTCIDGLDIQSSNYQKTLLFFDRLVNERYKNSSRIRGYYSPSHETKIIDTILPLINSDWKDLSRQEIENKLEVINKVFASMELSGSHLSDFLDIDISLFELALYLNDEHEIFIVTNYPEKLKEAREKWLEFRKDNEPREKDFIIISPDQAIYWINSISK